MNERIMTVVYASRSFLDVPHESHKGSQDEIQVSTAGHIYVHDRTRFALNHVMIYDYQIGLAVGRTFKSIRCDTLLTVVIDIQERTKSISIPVVLCLSPSLSFKLGIMIYA